MGISCDSPFVQQAFAEHEELDFPLASDANREAAEAYDVVLDDLVGVRNVADRAVFVIDGDRTIRYRWMGEVSGIPDPEDALAALDDLN